MCTDFIFYKLNDVWISLHMKMEKVMEVGGGNDYKTPHMGKDKLRREGRLEENLVTNVELINKCIQMIKTNKTKQ